MNKKLITVFTVITFLIESVGFDFPPSSGLSRRDTLRPLSLGITLKEPAVKLIYLDGSGKTEEEQLKGTELPGDEEVLIRIVPKTLKEKRGLQGLDLKPLWDKSQTASRLGSVFLSGGVASIGEVIPVEEIPTPGTPKKATITVTFKQGQDFGDSVSLSRITLLVDFKHIATTLGPKPLALVTDTCNDLFNNPDLWTDRQHVNSLIGNIITDRIELIEQPYGISKDIKDTITELLGWPQDKVLSEESFKQALDAIARHRQLLEREAATIAARAAQQKAAEQAGQISRKKRTRAKKELTRKAHRAIESIESLGGAENLAGILDIFTEEVLEEAPRFFHFSVVTSGEYIKNAFTPPDKIATILNEEAPFSKISPSVLKDILIEALEAELNHRKEDLGLGIKDLESRRLQLFRQRIPLPNRDDRIFYTLVVLDSTQSFLVPPRMVTQLGVKPFSYVKDFYDKKGGFYLDIFWSSLDLHKVWNSIDVSSCLVSGRDFLRLKRNRKLSCYVHSLPGGDSGYVITPDKVDKVIRETTPVVRVGNWSYQVKTAKIVILDPNKRPFMTIRDPEFYQFFSLYIQHILCILFQAYAEMSYPPTFDRTLRLTAPISRLKLFTRCMRGQLGRGSGYDKKYFSAISTRWAEAVDMILIDLKDKGDLVIIPKRKKRALPREMLAELDFLGYHNESFAVYAVKKQILPCEEEAALAEAVLAARFHYAYLATIFAGKNLPVIKLPPAERIFAVSDEVRNPLSPKITSRKATGGSKQSAAADLAINAAA